MRVVLDANVVAYVDSQSNGRLEEYALRFRRAVRQFMGRESDLLITLDSVKEFSNAQEQTRGRLVHAAQVTCTGILTPDSRTILLKDAFEPNPYAWSLTQEILPIQRLDRLEEVLGYWDVRRFLEGQRLDYEGLRECMGPLDELERRRRDVGTYGEFLESLRISVLRHLLARAVRENWIPRRPYGQEADLERFWARSIVHKVLVSFILANEYRLLAREQRATIEGAMTDLRQVIEASFSDAFVTRDHQLVECGRLVNLVMYAPRFVHLSELGV